MVKRRLRSALEQVTETLGVTLARRVASQDLRELVQQLRVADAWRDGSPLPLRRLGPDGDGGYLVPDDLEGLRYCFSPGVDRESRFELDLARQGLQVYMADASVDGPAVEHPRFHFSKKFLGSYSDGDSLLSMADWLSAAEPSAAGDTILQMDIEGAEYEVIHSLSQAALDRFRIIVLELHLLTRLANEWDFRLMAPALRKLLRSHAVVHIHPNNHAGGITAAGVFLPYVLEFTLLHRSRFDELRPTGRAFPHPLDRDNVPANPPLVLTDEWIWRD